MHVNLSWWRLASRRVRFRLPFCIERVVLSEHSTDVELSDVRGTVRSRMRSTRQTNERWYPDRIRTCNRPGRNRMRYPLRHGGKSDHHNLHRVGAGTATDMHHVGCSNRNR